MSGHHPFQHLVKNFSEERKLEIDRKKKELLAAIESTAANWHIDRSKAQIKNRDV